MVGEVVEEKLRELLTDPDAGLSLRPEVKLAFGSSFKILS